jgi:benzylsuccinate CoA-transferase BbsF subunit
MPCFNAEELYYNTHLKQRECWTKVQHPVAGDKMAISPPWKLSTTPAHISLPAHMFGQHSEYVLRESLGIS